MPNDIVVPKETDPQFQEKILEAVYQTRMFVLNKLHEFDIFKTVVDLYKQDRVGTVTHTIIAVLDALQQKLGSIDLRLAYSAATTTLVDLMNDVSTIGEQPLSNDEISQLIPQTMKSYLQGHKGEYDPVKLQQFLAEMQGKAQSGELSQLMTGAAQQSQDGRQTSNAQQGGA